MDQLEEKISSLEARLSEVELRADSQHRQLEDVAVMGAMITSLLNLDHILAAMMEMAIRSVRGEVGSIHLLENGKLCTKISWGVDEKVLELIRSETGVDIGSWTVSTGKPRIHNDLDAVHGDGGMVRGIISVPIAHQGEPIGVLIVINKENGEAFNAEDSVKLESLVRFAAVAISNAALMQDKLEQQRLQQELKLASTIQKALMPAPSARFDGAVIETVYQPAGQVGGDYFDIISLGDTEFVVIVGDVSNKGVPAALQMAAVRSAFRLEALDMRDSQEEYELTELIDRLNSFICEQVMLTDNMFVSLVCARFDLEAGECTYVNAGHIPPVHTSRESDEFQLLKTGGVALGQFPDFRYCSDTVKISSSDRILFYTDGLNESISPAGELFGRERVHQLAIQHRNCRLAEYPKKFIAAAETFRGEQNNDNLDDTTLLVVEVS